MAGKVAESCRNCGAELAPGSAFRTLCGMAVTNPAASPAPRAVPLSCPAQGKRAAAGTDTQPGPAPARAVPGIIPIGARPGGPLVGPVQAGESAQLATAELATRGAGRRLAAKIVDGVLPAILVGAALVTGPALLSVKESNGFRTIDVTWPAVLGCIASVLSLALIDRNPAGYDGEMIEHLVPIRDSSRPVSKTHLHVRAAGEGLWLTDRTPMTGSTITDAAGQKSELQGGTPALAKIGAAVHFGDRSFQVGQA